MFLIFSKIRKTFLANQNSYQKDVLAAWWEYTKLKLGLVVNVGLEKVNIDINLAAPENKAIIKGEIHCTRTF